MNRINRFITRHFGNTTVASPTDEVIASGPAAEVSPPASQPLSSHAIRRLNILKHLGLCFITADKLIKDEKFSEFKPDAVLVIMGHSSINISDLRDKAGNPIKKKYPEGMNVFTILGSGGAGKSCYKPATDIHQDAILTDIYDVWDLIKDPVDIAVIANADLRYRKPDLSSRDEKETRFLSDTPILLEKTDEYFHQTWGLWEIIKNEEGVSHMENGGYAKLYFDNAVINLLNQDEREERVYELKGRDRRKTVNLDELLERIQDEENYRGKLINNLVIINLSCQNFMDEDKDRGGIPGETEEYWNEHFYKKIGGKTKKAKVRSKTSVHKHRKTFRRRYRSKK